MRKITFFLLGFFCSIAVLAGEVSEEQALRKAQQILLGKKLTTTETARSRSAQKAETAYYVFNAEKNGGFAIIAADDQMPEVLGYAVRGHLDIEHAPDNVRWLMDYYASVAQQLKTRPAASRRAAARKTVSRPELAGLMNTQWDQGGRYQQECPELDGQKTLTGCVATAMAQVVNYFQWPLDNVREAVGYTTNKDETSKPQIKLASLPARKFNWFNMSDDDIAWLMRYCGQSVMMNYGLDESAASVAGLPNALISVFNYSKGVDLVERTEFADEEWEQVLYEEIEMGRPVIYNGFNDMSGHSFVLHGYKDGLFLVNWGWGGQLDGYFALTALTPGDMNYNEKQNAVVGIQPASNNDINYDEKPEIGFREVHLEQQGQLATLLPEDERYRISRLKITGVIGGKDIDVIHDMSVDRYGREPQGRLAKLDLSEARIVSGEKYRGSYDTHDDEAGMFMFQLCAKLNTIVLPNTLKTIGDYAFSNSGLTSIVIPKTVTEIVGSAFEVPSLTSLQVEEGNETYYSQNNAIYERATGILVRGCSASGIPEGVEEIGKEAFSNASLESIILPRTLKKIGARAFAYNDKVDDVYIPAGVTEIDESPFMMCFPKSITVDKDNQTFDSRDNCNAIIETATNKLIQASVGTTTIPATVTTLGRDAFALLPLNKVDIPQSVTNMRYAFMNIRSLTFRVHYPTPIEIGDDDFDDENMNYLPRNIRLIVPDGTKELYAAAKGWNVFAKGERLIVEDSEYEQLRSHTITVTEAGTLSAQIPEDKKNIFESLKIVGPINGVDLDCLKEMTKQGCMLTAIDLSEATIVDGAGTTANELPQEAFQNSSVLEHVVLPKNLTTIGKNAFQDTSVRELVVPKSVTAIGTDIFYYDRSLEALSVEPGNPVFDSRDNCNAIIETATNTLRVGCVNTVVPASVTSLGSMAFSGVPALKEISLPSGVTSIGWAAFWADTELTSVRLSESVTELGASPFGGCERITSFVIDEKNPKYDSRNNCNAIIETATNTLVQGFGTTKIPEGVTTIASAAFRSMSSLTEIDIPASVKSIEGEAFLYCNQLTKVVSRIKRPFAVSSMVFSGDNMKTAKLYVPYGTRQAYANTPGWSSFPYIIEMEPVEGEYAKNAASVASSSFPKAYTALNGQVTMPITLTGEGLEPITSIDYTITTGGKTTSHHLELNEPITYMMSSEVMIPLEADGATGENDKVFTLTKVNGGANECTTENMQAAGKLVTVAKKPKVVPVVEEATGTWCGWCARGIPALTLLNKVYKDDVITIAVHGGSAADPMILENYQLNVSGYPSCMVNRGSCVDPYYGSGNNAFGISHEIEAVQRSYVPAGIEVEAAWSDDSQQTINIKTTTTFVEDVANANYRIGYLLLADGLTGSTSDWYQSNYYAGSVSKDENLIGLTQSDSKIKGAVYKHVPVAAYEPFNGIEGSVPATITSDVPMFHTYQMNIAGNTRIQNKEKLTVVALLIDKSDGKIVNGAKFKFFEDEEDTAIKDLDSLQDVKNLNGACYTLDGRQLQGEPTAKGLYIINGKKILKK